MNNHPQQQQTAFCRYPARALGMAIIAALESTVDSPRSDLVSHCGGVYSSASVGAAGCAIVSILTSRPMPPQLPCSDVRLFSALTWLNIRQFYLACKSVHPGEAAAIWEKCQAGEMLEAALMCVNSPVHVSVMDEWLLNGDVCSLLDIWVNTVIKTTHHGIEVVLNIAAERAELMRMPT